MSPKKQPPKKSSASKSRETAVLEAVPRKAAKAPAQTSSVKASSNKLDFAPRSTEFVTPSKSNGGQASTSARDATEGRYVYGIIQASQPKTFGKTGIGSAGETVYTVHHGDVAAVVSKTSVFIFDPTRENALAHEHVIETVMTTNTIIPMSFGTVFRTEEDIKEVLKSIYPSLKDVLKQMSGKLEFGLKVTWDRDRVIEELKRDHEEIHRFHQELTKKHLQSTYFARMQLGRMIEKALAERSADYVREIYDALRSTCVASRDNKVIGDKMIMNAAFLINREKEADFDAAVNKVAQKFSDRLNFKYTGPWPPYNFVNIRLKLERAGS